MANMVVSAVVQETVSRVTSYLFRKRDCDDETTSRGHIIERLEMAHTELELALERSARMPITDVSLLRRRKLLKRAFNDCEDLLCMCSIKQQTSEVGGIGPALTTRSSFPKQIAHVTRWFISSYFAGFRKDSISCSDVRRFEWLAESANRFLRDVESGCSPQRYMFSNPLARKLIQGKTLEYEMVIGSILRRLCVWPSCVQGRGVELKLEFRYEDCRIPTRSFGLGLILRLSESTDIVGTAIRCLQSFTSSFKHVTEAVTGELAQLPLQDISHSHAHAAPCFSIQDLCSYDTQFWRPDPVCCCKANGCCCSYIPSELSCKFPEQVILTHVECYVSASECNLRNTTDGNGRDIVSDWPPLKLGVGFAPHFFYECMQTRTAVEIIGGKAERINDDGLEQMDEMVRPKAINQYISQPDLRDYRMGWYPGHGAAYFIVQKPGTEIASAPEADGAPKTWTSAKRRRSK